MSRKRRIDSADELYDDLNPNLASYQFDFRVTTPSASPSSNVHAALVPQTSQNSPRPAKKARNLVASNQQSDTTIRTYTRRIDRTEAIIKFLAEDKRYHLGDFLQETFASNNYEKLSSTSQSAVAFWLKGSSRDGTRPAEIVDAIYRHPAGLTRERNIVCRSKFSDLAPPAKPPSFASTNPIELSLLPTSSNSESLKAEQVNSRQGLQELMVRGTLHLVDHEANHCGKSRDSLLAPIGLGYYKGAPSELKSSS